MSGSTVTGMVNGVRHSVAAANTLIPSGYDYVRMLLEGIGRLDAPPTHKTPVFIKMLKICFR
ncbi:hypothetical protein PybrP1_012869 [[Pythium] brassicae (nom. inval.)]|nr:hypothetical protein PybrP1_012869 [[Pythium] brassicae (nom. inval.)]